MIVPNVLSIPSTNHPNAWIASQVLALSTTDFFRTWEPLPESGSMAFPRLLDGRGERFRKDRIVAGGDVGRSAFFLRSSWALMASALRRWREVSDGASVPGAPDISLRRLRESEGALPGDWIFNDGKVLPRRLAKISLDDDEGRTLDLSQESPGSELVVVAGWRLGFGLSTVEQEMRVGRDGRASTSYAMTFMDSHLEGLRAAVDLSGADDERLAMRVAVLILHSGQFTRPTVAPFRPLRSETPTGKQTAEESLGIGLARREGTSVTLKKRYRVSSRPLSKEKPYSRGIEIRIRPDASSGSLALHPLLAEKLWNPVYSQILRSIYGEPALA